MNKKIVKTVTGVVLSLSLAIAGSWGTAYAADTVRDDVVGASVYGNISTNSTSAIAVTTCGRSADIKAKAYVYYNDDGTVYYSEASASNTAGGVSATAKKKITNSLVVGGKGEHTVTYSNTTWGPMKTNTGNTPSNAKKL